MADTVERLYKVMVDATEAVNQLGKIASATQSVDDKMGKFAETLKKMGERLVEALAVKELVETFKSTVDALDETSKAAQRVGVASDQLQRLRYAASTSGASAEDMDKALIKLSSHMATINDQSVLASRTLKAFGVTASDTADSALVKIAKGFQALPDGVSKTAAAMTLFGKEVGTALVPMLNQGAQGLHDMGKAADDMGIVLSTNALKAAKELNDQFDTLNRQTTAMKENFVVGLLPAMTSIVTTLVDLKKNSADFRAAGDALGEGLIHAAMGASLLVTSILNLMAVRDGLQKFLTAPIWKWGDIYTETSAKIAKNNDQMITTMEHLQSTWKKTKEEIEKGFNGPPEPPGLAEDNLRKKLEALALAQKEYAEEGRIANEQWDEFLAMLEKIDGVMRATAVATEDAKQAQVGYNAAAEAMANQGLHASTPDEERVLDLQRKQNLALQEYIDHQGDAATNMQIWLGYLDKAGDKMDADSVSLRNFAHEQIDHANQTKESTEAMKEQQEVMKVFSEGFDHLTDSLISGSTSASQAFKQMAESIIADLLKIWAHKYILDAISGLFNRPGTPSSTATVVIEQAAMGAAFGAGQVLPFARGGVLSGPVMLPMALMGEAGPEAVMPLRRGADGNLGVAAAAASLNVNVHNYAGAAVSTQRDSSGDLQIIIEQTRKAIASDFRRGGNDVSRSAEGAYRLSRGNAAQR